MNTIRKDRRAAPAPRPARGYALRALPWALAAAFFVHLMMERGLHLYRAGPELTHALEACLAAAVLIWVWRALRRLEDLPEGGSVPLAPGDELYSWDDFGMSRTNPATGFPMMDRFFDIAGNPYGFHRDEE